MSRRREITDDALSAALAGLTAEERHVLAALAVVGGASLSAEAFAAVAAVAGLNDVAATVAELERRGLVRREDDRRRLAPGLVPWLRRAWDVTETAERVLGQLTSIAEDGRLTAEDLDAVLAVTEWAAETGNWDELLRLVRAAETAVSVHDRAMTWIAIVERVRVAAKAAGDGEAEAWADDRLARSRQAFTAASTGGAATARLSPRRASAAGRRGLRSLAAVTAAAAVAGGGFVAGSVIAGDTEGAAATTATLPPDTVTLPRQTVTRGGRTTTLPQRTVTSPGETVTLPAVTTTVTTTEVSTATTTVFTTPPAPG